MTLQVRHAIARSLPPWLKGPLAQSFFTDGLCTLYDIDSSWFQDALFSRYPTICDPSALPLLLLDRRLRRGPFTPELAVRRYLRLWIDQWQLAGLWSGLLLATQAFLAPEYPQIRIWTRGNATRQIAYKIEKGTVGRALNLPGFTPLAAGPGGGTELSERLRWSGTITREEAPPGTWDYDSVSEPTHSNRWWHFWMSIHGPPLSLPIYYDTGEVYNDPLIAWGTHYPFGEVDTLRQIILDFKPHETRCHTVIICEDDAEFDPLSPNAGNPAFGWPNGEWTWETKDDGFGNAISARRDDLRYIISNPND
jgi:hypothetical protein